MLIFLSAAQKFSIAYWIPSVGSESHVHGMFAEVRPDVSLTARVELRVRRWLTRGGGRGVVDDD